MVDKKIKLIAISVVPQVITKFNKSDWKIETSSQTE